MDCFENPPRLNVAELEPHGLCSVRLLGGLGGRVSSLLPHDFILLSPHHCTHASYISSDALTGSNTHKTRSHDPNSSPFCFPLQFLTIASFGFSPLFLHLPTACCHRSRVLLLPVRYARPGGPLPVHQLWAWQRVDHQHESPRAT